MRVDEFEIAAPVYSKRELTRQFDRPDAEERILEPNHEALFDQLGPQPVGCMAFSHLLHATLEAIEQGGVGQHQSNHRGQSNERGPARQAAIA